MKYDSRRRFAHILRSSYFEKNIFQLVMQLRVLYEDNHLLAVAKPAGIATVGVAEDDVSLAKLAKQYLKNRYQKPGNVYLGVVSRLDLLVSGVVLFARTSKAAARLSEQFRNRDVAKSYLAAVEGVIEPVEATLEDWLAKNDQRHKVEVVASSAPGAQVARLTYRRLVAKPDASLVEIQLETGRKHQIRVQMASHGHPVLGDIKYGSRRRFPHGIALHAAQLIVRHPTRDEEVTIACPPPQTWECLGFDKRHLSGDSS